MPLLFPFSFAPFLLVLSSAVPDTCMLESTTETNIRIVNDLQKYKILTLRCSAISFSSTLQIMFSLSLSLMYTSMYAFEYLANLNGELLKPGFICGNWRLK